MTDSVSVDDAAQQRSAPGVVEWIKRLTAVVAALTTLVAGMTALVVAGKAGWSEVGPYFGNLVRHGEVDIPPRPRIEANPVAYDAIDPALLSDLERDDSRLRRQARDTLAGAIAKASPQSVDALIGQLAAAHSYRTQLGIAVALHNAPGGWSAGDGAAADARLQMLIDNTKDATLRAELVAASRARRP